MIVLVFLTVSSVVVGGVILVNNYLDNLEETLKTGENTVLTDDNNLKESNTNEEVINGEIVTKELSTSESGGGGSGGSSDGETTLEVTIPVVCKDEYIQYSLKNFKEQTECLEDFEGKCIKFVADCSVDVHNLDVNVEDNFEIEYSLTDTSNKKLDLTLLSNNVKINSPVIFKTNFTIEDSSGIDPLSTCKIKMITIPQKEVCA